MGILDLFRERRRAEQPAPAKSGRALGGSGRGHNSGFLELEELNADLLHPAWHRTADEMYRTDGDVRQVIQLAMNPLIAGTWDVTPHGGQEAKDRDQLVAKVVRWALWDFMRPNLLGHLIEFLPVLLRSGFAPGEIVWGLADCPIEGAPPKVLVPKRIELRLPRSIWRWPQRDGELLGVEQFLPAGGPGTTGSASTRAFDWMRGDPGVVTTGGASGGGPGTVFIPAKQLVYYRVGAEGDNWEGVPLLRPAYKHWFLKDKIERLDAIAQEREAMGIPVVYPPPQATDADLDDMEEALKQLRGNEQGYIVMPGMKAGSGAADNTGWLFEIMGYDRSGSGRDPTPSLQYHTQKIAAAFIAEFMRLGHGQTGARATAQVQADPFLMSVEALSTIIEQSLNDALVVPITAMNFADVDSPPKLANSLVDSTSLSQLADFVLKLTQVGALLPDQELEDFLRARADLPPANPEAVKKRGDDEEKIRRMIVGGDPEQAAANDPYGSNDPALRGTRHRDAGGSGRDRRATSGAPRGAGGRGQGSPRGAAKNLDDGHDLSEHLFAVDLDSLEAEMDAAPDAMHHACRGHVEDERALRDAILGQLQGHYASGRAHVAAELGIEDGLVLDRGAIDRGQHGLVRRAELAARQVRDRIGYAVAMNDLHHGDARTAGAQLAAEFAAQTALRAAGREHGVAALLQGRHDFALENADGVLGVRYTAILDRGTCAECEHADDGVVRALDDPIRLDRRPPNRHCHSLASGENRCRCFEVYEPLPPSGEHQAVLDAAPGGMPPLMASIVRGQLARGFDLDRAVAVALARLRLWAAGRGRVSPAQAQRAADELAAWGR